MFVNILTTDDKRFLVNKDNLRQPINTQLSQKKNYFMNLWWLMADVFAKLGTPKNEIR